jgi:hypothetical protein
MRELPSLLDNQSVGDKKSPRSELNIRKRDEYVKAKRTFLHFFYFFLTKFENMIVFSILCL